MTEISEVEKLYLPSYWSKRYSSNVLLQKFWEFTSKLSNEIKAEVPCELDIPYGDQENEKLDIFGTTLPNDAPIFIFIHGGYWQEETVQRKNSSLMARSLYNNGYKTIVVGYTLCPHTTISGIIKEIQKSLRKCLKYALEYKARSISIGGHSAGAHLAISLFPNFFNTLTNEEQNLIKSVFLISGIYNLIPLVQTTINDPLKLTEFSAKALSPMFQDYRALATIPTTFFVIVSENDSPAFVDQAQHFHDHLNTQAVHCEFVFLKELDHFDIVEKMDDENYEIIKLILKSLD